MKHRLADILVAVQGAQAAALYAAWALSTEQSDRSVAADVASLSCAEALYVAATGAIQVFGGIGFTWDHSIHFFLKRALSGRAVGVSLAELRRRLATAEVAR